ncbi:methyltransferase family protein [Sinobacterium caligoides]|uniref:Methyltransferase family protein n=1 Tax=Sinobacterium caligoides TaxID=933926 RepID=A0A3N2DKW2_9GAMM|nr:methyltransferase domain-containing protein [Sinobacterium caligoides]ROR99984.1 methyltransferase family protein [Sinobacterium caligoides]
MSGYRFRAPRPSLEQAQPALQAWYESVYGQHILCQEQALVGDLLRQSYGNMLLQLSTYGKAELYSESRVSANYSLSCFREGSHEGHMAISEFESLPIATESMDVVVLHHALEFSMHPHQILREAQRILLPHGRIIVVGINPLSMLGLESRLLGIGQSVKAKAGPISVSRLDDWLHLLGFGAPKLRYDCYEAPTNFKRLLNSFVFLGQLAARFQLPGGGVYIVEAVKEVQRMTPIKPSWRRFQRGFDIPVMGGVATSKAAKQSSRRTNKSC